jgi:hypothetical protein
MRRLAWTSRSSTRDDRRACPLAADGYVVWTCALNDPPSWRGLTDLRERRLVTAPHLLVACVPIHAKVVVRDADMAVVSSTLWLSNTADHNVEFGVIVEEPALAQQMRSNVMELAKARFLLYGGGLGRRVARELRPSRRR